MGCIGGDDQHRIFAGSAGPIKEAVDGVPETLTYLSISISEQGVGLVDEENGAFGVILGPVEDLVDFLNAFHA